MSHVNMSITDSHHQDTNSRRGTKDQDIKLNIYYLCVHNISKVQNCM